MCPGKIITILIINDKIFSSPERKGFYRGSFPPLKTSTFSGVKKTKKNNAGRNQSKCCRRQATAGLRIVTIVKTAEQKDSEYLNKRGRTSAALLWLDSHKMICSVPVSECCEICRASCSWWFSGYILDVSWYNAALRVRGHPKDGHKSR